MPVLALVAAEASELRAAAPAVLTPALLEVTVNGQRFTEPAAVLRGSGDAVYVSVALLRTWRLRTDDLPTEDIDGTAYVALHQVPGVAIAIEQQTQSLTLTARPELLQETRVALRPRESGPMTQSGWGGFLNYDLLAESDTDELSLNGAVEVGAFSPHGFGTTSFVGRWDGRGVRLTRLETNWTIDDPERMRSLRLGDGITRGGVGGAPLRFGGIQFARNFEVQPGFVTIPLRSLSGSASLPSVVDVYVNGVLQGRSDVGAGPFQVTDLPVLSGSGKVQLVVRDLLGREAIVNESYYAAPQLLRRGLHDFSYEAGFLRNAFGRRSADYGAFFVSGTHRFGVTDHLTAEAHVEASRQVQVAGASAALVAPGFGFLSAGVAASNSKRGTGTSVRVGLERRTPTLSYGAVAEFVSDDFVTTGSAAESRRPASSVQAFASLPLPFGSAGLSYLRRDARGEGDLDVLSANATIRLGRLGTLSIAGRRSFGARDETAVEFFLSVPLGPRRHASASVSSRGGLSLAGAFEQSLPIGEGIGYRLAGELGRFDRLQGRIGLQTGHGAYDAQLSWAEGELGGRIGASGSVGAVGRHLFAARRLTRSFASVEVAGFPGVRVYADNQLVGRTDASGAAIVPTLRPFEGNLVQIELADLPMDAEVSEHQRTVRPYDRSGVSVSFDVRRIRSARLKVVLENGEPLPEGTSVRVAGNDREFVVAPGGDLYLGGLQERNVVQASFDGGTCRFELVLPQSSEPQPQLGQYRCERVPT